MYKSISTSITFFRTQFFLVLEEVRMMFLKVWFHFHNFVCMNEKKWKLTSKVRHQALWRMNLCFKSFWQFMIMMCLRDRYVYIISMIYIVLTLFLIALSKSRSKVPSYLPDFSRSINTKQTLCLKPYILIFRAQFLSKPKKYETILHVTSLSVLNRHYKLTS